MTLSPGVVCEGFTCQKLRVKVQTAYAAGAHFWRIALTWGVLCLRRCKSYGLPVVLGGHSFCDPEGRYTRHEVTASRVGGLRS